MTEERKQRTQCHMLTFLQPWDSEDVLCVRMGCHCMIYCLIKKESVCSDPNSFKSGTTLHIRNFKLTYQVTINFPYIYRERKLNLFKRKYFIFSLLFSYKTWIHFVSFCFSYFSNIAHSLRKFFFFRFSFNRDTLNEFSFEIKTVTWLKSEKFHKSR